MGRPGGGRPGVATARTAAVSLEPARRRPAHHQLRRRQHELEIRPAGSRSPASRSVSWRSRAAAATCARWARPALRSCISTSSSGHRAVSRRGVRGRDGRAVPAVRFGESRVAASIDTPLTRSCRSTTSTTCIRTGPSRSPRAPTAAAKLEEFNKKYRPEDHLGALAAPRVRAGADAEAVGRGNPGCDGLILGGHGLFTWGDTQKECYLNSVRTIDQMGEFVQDHRDRSGAPLFGGQGTAAVADREAAVIEIFPSLRGAVSSNRRVIGHYDGSEGRDHVRQLPMGRRSARWARAARITSSGRGSLPMFIPWNPGHETGAVRDRIAERITRSAGLRRLLPGVRRARVAEASRQQPLGGGRAGALELPPRTGCCREAWASPAQRTLCSRPA